MLFSQAASANNSEDVARLVIKPGQCVSMHQGQQCYVDVDIHWQTQQPGQYCLMTSQQSSVLKCWNGNSNGRYQHEIVASENVVYSLTSKENYRVLATGKLEMSWVYQKNNRVNSSWRVF